MKVCSFLPSATEVVYELGLGENLCGVTSECDYPPEARSKPVVVRSLFDPASMAQREIDSRVARDIHHGHGIHRIDRELLLRERPDVLITQELCDVCSVSLRDVMKAVSELSTTCRVISLKPRGLEGVFEDILEIGDACGAGTRAEKLVSSLRARVNAVRDDSLSLPRRRVFCVEWYDPLFASGHWIPEMVEIAGGFEVLGRAHEDSRGVEWKEVVESDPEVIILMPCGFGVARAVSDLGLLKRLDGWKDVRAVRDGSVYATDGSSIFSRPGPRLVDGVEILAQAIHPEVFGGGAPGAGALRVPGL